MKPLGNRQVVPCEVRVLTFPPPVRVAPGRGLTGLLAVWRPPGRLPTALYVTRSLSGSGIWELGDGVLICSFFYSVLTLCTLRSLGKQTPGREVRGKQPARGPATLPSRDQGACLPRGRAWV